MKIRAATLDDIPALVALNADVQAHHVAAEPGIYRTPDPEVVAAWFRGEHERTLPVVVSFRWWRMGHQDTEAFHKRLDDDDCGRALGLGPVAPMQAVVELNDWIVRKEIP